MRYGCSCAAVPETGDSLLLTAWAESGGRLEIDPYGSRTFHLDGVNGGTFEVEYAWWGVYVAAARIDLNGDGDCLDEGEEVGTLTVIVIDVLPIGPIACQVGYTREKYVWVRPYGCPEEEVHFGAVDPDYLGGVAVKEYDNAGAIIYLTPLARGTPVLTARIGGADGPIAAYREVDEFTLDVPATCCVVVNGETDVGTSKLTMRPYVPDFVFEFDMFGSQSTFAGGATYFTINISDVESSIGEPGFEQVLDETTGETVGEFLYDLEIPEGETQFCFNITGKQASSDWKVIAKKEGVNGKKCEATLDEIKVCYGTKKNLEVATISDFPGTHAIVIVDDGDSIQPPPRFTAADPEVECVDGGWFHEFEVEGRGDPGYYDVKIADTVFPDAIKVPQYPTGVTSTSIFSPAGPYGANYEHTCSVGDPAFENLNNSEIDMRERVTIPPNIYGWPVGVLDIEGDFFPGNTVRDSIVTFKANTDASLDDNCSLLPNTFSTPQLLQWKCVDEGDAKYRTFEHISITFQVLQGRIDGTPFRWAITTDNDVSRTETGGWICPIP